jgi:hypothetical protein
VHTRAGGLLQEGLPRTPSQVLWLMASESISEASGCADPLKHRVCTEVGGRKRDGTTHAKEVPQSAARMTSLLIFDGGSRTVLVSRARIGAIKNASVVKINTPHTEGHQEVGRQTPRHLCGLLIQGLYAPGWHAPACARRLAGPKANVKLSKLQRREQVGRALRDPFAARQRR